MLCLTRKPGQSLAIGTDITITVLDVHGNIVRLGIEAPVTLPIVRDDVIKTKPAKERESQ